MDSFIEKLIARIESDPDLNVTNLSVAAGLDKSTIRQMITFRRNPRIDTARKICGALGTTYEQFMSEGRSPARAELSTLVDQLSDAEIDFLLDVARAQRERLRGEG